MVDYSLASQVQQFQAPNLLALAAQGQQMQSNAMKTQLLQDEAARESRLRQLYATPGFDLSSPESIRQVGALGGPEMAQRAALTATQTRKAQTELSNEERKLVSEQGSEFRNLLTGLVSMSESDPARAADIYTSVYAKLPEGIKQRYSPTFNARTAVQALRTTDQLLTQYAPKTPVRGKVGETDVVYDPEDPTRAYETTVVPARRAGAPAGVPSYPMRAAAAVDMAQRGQRYAPELMTDVAPANAMAPAAAPSPYGGLNAMAGSQAGVPSSQLAQQQKDVEAQRKLKAIGEETLMRERTQAEFKKETADVETSKQLTTAIKELENAAKPGGLIEQSTGSGAGAALDAAAGFFGVGTSGARAIGQLQPIADLVLKMVPRFEGPQSNADVASYNKAAGQIADSNVPNSIRLDAAKTLIRLMKERKDQFVMQGTGAAQPKVVNFGDLK
jgi:hypothetical protein